MLCDNPRQIPAPSSCAPVPWDDPSGVFMCCFPPGQHSASLPWAAPKSVPNCPDHLQLLLQDGDKGLRHGSSSLSCSEEQSSPKHCDFRDLLHEGNDPCCRNFTGSPQGGNLGAVDVCRLEMAVLKRGEVAGCGGELLFAVLAGWASTLMPI